MARLGTTFSQIQCKYLKIDYKETLKAILTLPLEYIRVCAYWNEIEPQPGQFNFTILDDIISTISKTDKKIVLAVGMKSPRWPEFHFPDWVKQKCDTKLAHIPIDTQTELSSAAFNFISAVISRYKDNHSISYLQIENEAFNNFSFTHNKFVSYSFVRRAVILARTLCPEKKILLSNAINLAPFDWRREYSSAFEKNLTIADAIGVNVYTKVPVNKQYYAHPTIFFWWRLSKWRKQMQKLGIESWITEAQSEPWEYKSAVHTDKKEYPSASPQRTKSLINKLDKIGYQVILLWGCEYWYWSKLQGRNDWWKGVESL
ncbi:MAG: beta-galactosidase [bacterium]|nr:beta-galactosidase [bacterium]